LTDDLAAGMNVATDISSTCCILSCL